MYEDENSIIETIKSGQLPEIKPYVSEGHDGLETSQRGLEITNYGLNSDNKKQ